MLLKRVIILFLYQVVCIFKKKGEKQNGKRRNLNGAIPCFFVALCQIF
jgi:hypothetical protein